MLRMNSTLPASPAKPRIPWIGICLYFLLAVLISTPFRFSTWQWYRDLELPFHLTVFKYVLGGLGPLLGAIVAWRLFPAAQRTVTLLGTSPRRSLIAAALPLVLFTLLGCDNSLGIDRHAFGLLISFEVLLYCLFEEAGWRGYLQDALAPLPTLAWTAIIGALWFLWHLTFLRPHYHFRNDWLFLAALFLGAWGLGNIALRTGSLALSACFHLVVNMLLFDSLVSGISLRNRLIGCAIIVAVGIYLICTWPSRRSCAPFSRPAEPDPLVHTGS